MAHRTFVDDGGTPWAVWEVRPQWTDRRQGGDRRRTASSEHADPPVLEHRRGTDRRKGDGNGLRRVKLANGFSGGWLIFESGADRRRLSPIPPDWETAPEGQLADLCSRATAPRTRSNPAD